MYQIGPANSGTGKITRPPPLPASGNDAVGVEESFRLAKRFFLNQSVSVNVEGCGWLVGTVVFIAKTVQSLTGSTVRVRYSIPTERSERETGFPNHPDYIRPL